MAGFVALFVVVGHIWSVDTGLFLDDHAHYAHLREADWSFLGAVEASRLGIVGDVMDLWGRHEAGLRFFRPIAFWIMKTEYTIAGWQPGWMHGFSLGWHFLCCMLAGALAMRCFGSRLWATVAACLMAIHPGHMATVYWIACQTELFTTAFLLLGVLAYGRAAGWWDAGPAFLRTGDAVGAPARGGAGVRVFFGLMAVLFYALALGCRENAILFPVVCWAGDVLLRSPRRWIRWEHAALLGVLGLYLVLRTVYLGGFPMPARPYIMPLADPGFPRYLVEKIVYYTIGLFGYVPVIPMGGQAYFASRPMPFYGGFVLTLAVLTAIWGAYRFRRALIWPAVWMAMLFAPVLPVFASSHHLYLPGVGGVLLMTAGLAALGGLVSSVRPLPTPQVVVCGLVLLLHAVGLGLLTWASGFAYRTGTLTEDILIQDVLRRGRELRDGDHLFFINMPLLAYYAVPAIEMQTGRRNLHGHVLTFSPWLLRMESPGSVEVPDRHTLIVRAPEDAPFFEGVTGRTLLEAMGIRELPAEGVTLQEDGALFGVTARGVTPGGIRAFEFRFKGPLNSPNYHVFYGSPHFLAYPLPIPGSPAPSTQPQ